MVEDSGDSTVDGIEQTVSGVQAIWGCLTSRELSLEYIRMFGEPPVESLSDAQVTELMAVKLRRDLEVNREPHST